MNILDKQQWRSSFLAATSFGLSIVTIYSLFVPAAGDRPVSDFVFPDRVPLNNWLQQDSREIVSKAKNLEVETDTETEDLEIIKSANGYSYTKENQNLTIEMRYLVGTTGDIKRYLQKYTEIPIPDFKSKQIENIENIGHHVLFISSDRAYLSSCIVAGGDSKINPQQFSQHLAKTRQQYRLWLDWLQGKGSIRDRRCLWTNLSVSLTNTSPELAYKTLETAWVDWYQWWKPQFPKL